MTSAHVDINFFFFQKLLKKIETTYLERSQSICNVRILIFLIHTTNSFVQYISPSLLFFTKKKAEKSKNTFLFLGILIPLKHSAADIFIIYLISILV